MEFAFGRLGDMSGHSHKRRVWNAYLDSPDVDILYL